MKDYDKVKKSSYRNPIQDRGRRKKDHATSFSPVTSTK